jgi:nanoRNase/pAp phosphatase (c-di-AMP/oligoRNAs hydrolase)
VEREENGGKIKQAVRQSVKQLEMKDYLEGRRGERHVVVLQDYPDPDAISCAFAYQLIAENFDIKADILYSGKISHQENIALVRLVGVPLIKFDSSLDLAHYDGAVFVDNQGTTARDIVQALERAAVPPLIVIDHHEPQNRIKPEYKDIRRTGAAATIITRYIQDGLLDFDRSRKEHVLAATALLHGIMTDTGNFIRAKDEDFSASSYLSRFRDSDLLKQIRSQSRSRQLMNVIHQALVNRVVAESFSIAGIGYLRGDDRDVIPQAADFILTEENVHTAIVYGIVTDTNREEKVIGSMRTSKLTLDPDQFIKDVLGKDTKGHFFGGGKLSAGGFEIPVGFLSGGDIEEYQEIKWKVYDNQIKQKLFSKIGIIQKQKEE